MHDKPITAAIYLLVGLLLAFAPLLVETFGRAAQGRSEGGVVRPLIVSGAGLSPWGCAAGLALGLTLPWWLPGSMGPTLDEIRGYLAVAVVALFALNRDARTLESRLSPAWRWGLVGIAVVLAAIVCFSTGFMEDPNVRFTAWHHWGAFVAPAEVMRAGGRIFNDFPTQYGLGPTTLVALACGRDCWTGMYFVACGAALVFAALGFLLVASLGFKTRLGLAAALAVAFAAFLLWVSYAPLVSSPNDTPSVTGLRFLPPLTLAALLWCSEINPTLARWWRPMGFLLLAIGALWSPEALFMTTAVWGPYYCLRQLAQAPAGTRAKVLMVCLLQIAGVLAATALLFLVVYGLAYGARPRMKAYLLYVLYPPGPMPINFKGPIWFSATAVAMGAWVAWKTYRTDGNTGPFRRTLMLTLLAFSSLSYAMGRSHDNNFLNLLPYSVLVLGGLACMPLARSVRGVAAGMLASLLALLPTFGWGAWDLAIAHGRLAQFNPRGFIASLSYTDPSAQADLAKTEPRALTNPPDAARALQYIRSVSTDPIELVDSTYLDLRDGGVWMAMHGFANFYFAPSSYRQWFLANAARRFHRSGWLVIQKTRIPDWTPDFQVVYVADQDLDFGDYRAFHFKPRS